MRVRVKNPLLGPTGIALGQDLDLLTASQHGPFSGVAGQATGVQRAGSSSAALTVAYPNPTSTGNFLVVGAAWYNTGLPTVSDNAGNTWQLAVAVTTGSLRCGIWYCANANGSANHQVTFTPNTAMFLTVGLNEYAIRNRSAAGVLDQSASNSGSSNAPSSGAVTTAASGELYVAACCPNGFDLTPGWTDVYTHATGANLGFSMESQGDGTVLAGGGYSAPWSLSGSTTWSAVIATFKP